MDTKKGTVCFTMRSRSMQNSFAKNWQNVGIFEIFSSFVFFHNFTFLGTDFKYPLRALKTRCIAEQSIFYYLRCLQNYYTFSQDLWLNASNLRKNAKKRVFFQIFILHGNMSSLNHQSKMLRFSNADSSVLKRLGIMCQPIYSFVWLH